MHGCQRFRRGPPSSAREVAGVDPLTQHERRPYRAHQAGLPAESRPLTNPVDGFESGAMGAEEVLETGCLELVGRPAEALVVEGIEMKASEDGVDGGGPDDLAGVLD